MPVAQFPHLWYFSLDLLRLRWRVSILILDFWFAAVGLLDISEMEMVVFHHARKLIYLPATLSFLMVG